MAGKISESKTIPDLLEVVRATGIEVPAIARDPPLPGFWQKKITVVEGLSPAPRYTATAVISDEFPFNFAASLENPQLKVNLTIDVFETVPQLQENRGIRATVFPVPRSDEHPNGVIVKRGLTFVDTAGNPVEDSLSTQKIPDESRVPIEAVIKLDAP